MTDLRGATSLGMIDKTPHYNSIFNVLDRESLTPLSFRNSLRALRCRLRPLKRTSRLIRLDSARSRSIVTAARNMATTRTRATM